MTWINYFEFFTILLGMIFLVFKGHHLFLSAWAAKTNKAFNLKDIFNCTLYEVLFYLLECYCVIQFLKWLGKVL